MKKVLFGIAAVLCGMTGCTKSPTSVAEKFVTAIELGKIEEAKTYCTERTAKVLDMASAFGGAHLNPNFEIEEMRDSVVGNIAYVFYKEKGKDREESVTLYKIDGEWKVDMDQKK